jgi:hypothetical protein
MNDRSTRSVTARPIKERKKLRSKKRQCDARTGNLQMDGWTMRSDKPSPPVTRYRSFKMFEGAESKRVEANEVFAIGQRNVDDGIRSRDVGGWAVVHRK